MEKRELHPDSRRIAGHPRCHVCHFLALFEEDGLWPDTHRRTSPVLVSRISCLPLAPAYWHWVFGSGLVMSRVQIMSIASQV